MFPSHHHGVELQFMTTFNIYKNYLEHVGSKLFPYVNELFHNDTKLLLSTIHKNALPVKQGV
jgi:hypothetical protein